MEHNTLIITVTHPVDKSIKTIYETYHTIHDFVQDHGMEFTVQRSLLDDGRDFNSWLYENHNCKEIFERVIDTNNIGILQNFIADYLDYLEIEISDEYTDNIIWTVKKDFGQCPYCGSYNHEDMDTEFETDYINTTFQCKECGAEWTDHSFMQYSGYTKQTESGDRIFDCESQYQGKD